MNYDASGLKTTVTDPLSAARVYTFQKVGRSLLTTGITQPAGAGCPSASTAITYDTRGNTATRVELNGTMTTFNWDPVRNLEIQHVEASGTTNARTTSTSWHANYHLPLKIAKPLLLTTFAYDAAGNLLTRTEQTTTDANGSFGLTPTITGPARTWTYTYNSYGQLLSAQSPRTDMIEKTLYVYDTNGNLASVTSPTGKITSFSNYDANGRAGLITYPNQATSAIAYDSRGRMVSQTEATSGISHTTSMTYSPAGLLVQTTFPDNSYVSYSYDAAHRMTSVSDNLGNTTSYTLDNMGNKTKETVSDSSGILTRQITRSMDILNRVQQITGGAQ